MKQINNYILEKLHLNKDVKKVYYPNNKKELIKIIKDLIKERGCDANLNDICTSNITTMSYLFEGLRHEIRNIDISKWDVSKVKDMDSMFQDCNDFNCDLSNWDVSKVENMEFMFFNCNQFNSDLSKWDVHKVTNMDCMFSSCVNFESDLSNWNISKVTNTSMMFDDCKKFNSDLSKWNVSNVTHMFKMFSGCEKFNCDLNNWKLKPGLVDRANMFKDTPLENNLPKWYEAN